MATPSISYLALDAEYDPVFTTASVLHGVDAVAQAVLTRLNLFYGEWFENLKLGLPVFQNILGQLGSQQGIQAMEQLIRSNIDGAPFVTDVYDVAVTFIGGQFKFTASFNTIFGPASVNSNLPGINLNLG